MDNISKTLYIPLFGKAYASKRGLILRDETAEKIWEQNAFPLIGKAASKWLAFYMGMRAAVFDRWVQAQMQQQKDALVLHLGCGLDSRIHRVGDAGCEWYDVDLPDVIRERTRYYTETERYHMLAADLRDTGFVSTLPPAASLIVVMEGVSMYLTEAQLQQLMKALSAAFEKTALLMDCYTGFAAKTSRYRNPINEVGVSEVYGVDNPAALVENTGLRFVREHEMTPAEMTNQLQGMEKQIFKTVYGGNLSKKLYRLYEFEG